jgi:hypothetical protein
VNWLSKIPLAVRRRIGRMCGLGSVALAAWHHDFIGLALVGSAFLLVLESE